MFNEMCVFSNRVCVCRKQGDKNMYTLCLFRSHYALYVNEQNVVYHRQLTKPNRVERQQPEKQQKKPPSLEKRTSFMYPACKEKRK